jgi:hypothetical protein
LNGVGDADPSGLGQGLEPRGDVDPIAEQVIAFHDDIPKIDTDAEDDAPVGLGLGLLSGHRILHGHRAGYRVDNGAELDQRTVTHELYEAALVLGQQGIDHLTPQSSDGGERFRLIHFDEV